ncbi:hypothetical protein O181_023327 [Austropuccinia psidii MF-1]|uniref:Uncharacterized protein n=1 Tax=Austropuccinia psidii MF-1 TaxID=1389203 RepID=A0A9Q3GXX8_9BASI|nr:hypothetical protein [Austropuccinia psidii MF-1]
MEGKIRCSPPISSLASPLSASNGRRGPALESWRSGFRSLILLVTYKLESHLDIAETRYRRPQVHYLIFPLQSAIRVPGRRHNVLC